CEALNVPLPKALQLVEGGNELGAVWLAIMIQDRLGRHWGKFVVKDLSPDSIQLAFSRLPSKPDTPPPVELLAGMVAVDDEHGTRDWQQLVARIGKPLVSGSVGNDAQNIQLPWRVRWLWVLAQHGSGAARSSLRRIVPKVLAKVKKSDLALAWGIALEYMITAPPAGEPRTLCEDLLSRASGHSEFHNLLMSWEGGQRVVPFVRMTG